MTMEMEGKFSAPGSENSSMHSIHYRKGELWRIEAEMNMGGSAGNALNTISLFDGEDHWSVAMGMKTKLPKGQIPAQSDANSYWNRPPEGSKIVGDETISGRDCWIIEYPENPIMKSPPRHWIDKDQFVFVRSVSILSGKPIRSEFSDFRTVNDDFEIPHHIEVFSGDDQTMTIDITKLEIGTGLSDELFNAETLEGSGMPDLQNMDLDALMKQAEEMRKKYEKMQPQDEQGN
jgi:hypothetical protein